MPDYYCPTCGDLFDLPVWHCPACGAHWPTEWADECASCHRFEWRDGDVHRIDGDEEEDDQ